DPDRFPAVELDRNAAERSGYLDLETRVANAVLRTGLRIDALNATQAIQPRISLALGLGRSFWATVAAGQAARLLHLVSDAARDPKVAYYDIWLLTGEDGVPTARSNNLTAEVGWSSGLSSARIGVFGSAGEGQIDLVSTIPRNTTGAPWRAGKSRVRGAEVEATTASEDGQWSGRVSYTLAQSDRDWGDGWVPWANDRRHQLRVSGSLRPFGRTTFSPSMEAGTGQPYTPFMGVERSGRSFREVYGTENSARGEIGIRFGATVEQGLRGPFGSDVSVGLSVTNFGFGDQGPREYDIDFIPESEDGQLLGAVPASRQVSELPVIPSLLLRIAF
ncbi:MAG TPA: hypothetical protein PLL69_12595, partial [Gemmatimonadales bacterium]|nr:hypothetical protein [Gemmatimonadales bacterium]